MKNLRETSIPGIYVQHAYNAGWNFDAKDVELIYSVTVRAISEFLSIKKSKNQPVALAVKNLRDETLLIGKVAYHENAEDGMPGNWSYELAFNEEDMNLTDTTVFMSTDLGFYEVLLRTLKLLASIEFTDSQCAHILTISVCQTLKQWCDENANDGELVEVMLEGYFVVTVGVEEGSKVLSIVPDGAMKTIIKDDSALIIE